MEVEKKMIKKKSRFVEGVIGCGTLIGAFAASKTVISPLNAVVISAVVLVIYIFILFLVNKYGLTVRDQDSRVVKYRTLKSGYHLYVAGALCVLLFPALFPEKNATFINHTTEQDILTEIPKFDSSSFSILILKFNNRRSHSFEYDIAEVIKTRFLSLASTEKLNIEVNYYPVSVDFNDTVLLGKIADSSNASLLLHGDYLVFSDDSVQTSIHYYLNKELPFADLRSEFTKPRSIGIHEIFMGRSLEEIDNSVYFYFAQDAFSDGNWQESIDFFVKINDRFWKRNAEKYIPLGYCYIKSKDTVAAMNAYRKSLKFKPSAQALGNLALIEDMKGNRAAAMSLYRQAIRVDSLHLRAWINYGIALYKVGKFDSSEQMLKHAAYQSRDSYTKHDALSGLGTLYEWKRDTLTAIQFYKQAIQTKSNQLESNFNLCRLYWRLNEIDSSEFYVNKALEIDSTNPSAQIIKGLVVMKIVRKNILAAQKYYQKSTEQKPEWKSDVYDEIFMLK